MRVDRAQGRRLASPSEDYAAAPIFASGGTTTLVKYPQSGHSNATSPGASHSASICMISSMVPEHRWHRIARLRLREKQSAIAGPLSWGFAMSDTTHNCETCFKSKDLL
jgi:hypothetical protein